MERFSKTIRNLELRTCDIHLLLQGEHTTAVIVQWFPRDEGKPFCIALAYWRCDDEGFYLHFVGSRPFDKEVDSNDFWALLQEGQNRLNQVFEESED